MVYDALAVGQSIQNGTDERVVLFVKLGEAECLSDELVNAIRAQVRARRSARHVPEKVSSLAPVKPTDRCGFWLDYSSGRRAVHIERETGGSTCEEGESAVYLG